MLDARAHQSRRQFNPKMAVTLDADMGAADSQSPTSGKLQSDKSNSSSSSTPAKNKASYKHIPHSQKPPHLVAKRNARERRRVQAVNQAFLRLRKSVPIENRNKRVSKVKTLQRAIDYIRKLERILAADEPTGDQQQDQVSSSSQLGQSCSLSRAPPSKPAAAAAAKQAQHCDPGTSKQLPALRRGRKPASQQPVKSAEPMESSQNQQACAPQVYSSYPGYYHCPSLAAAPASVEPAASGGFCPAGSLQGAAGYASAPSQADANLYAMSQAQAPQQFHSYRLNDSYRYSQHQVNYSAGQRWIGPAPAPLLPPPPALQSPSSSSTSSASLGVCESPTSSGSSASSASARPQAQQQVRSYLSYGVPTHLSMSGQQLSANTTDSNNDNLDGAYDHSVAIQAQLQQQQQPNQQQTLVDQQAHQTGSECKTSASGAHDELLMHQQQQLSGLHPPTQVRPPLLLLTSNVAAEQQINNTPAASTSTSTSTSTSASASAMAANGDANLHEHQLQHHHQYQQQSFSINQHRSHLSGQLVSLDQQQQPQELIDERQPVAGYH